MERHRPDTARETSRQQALPSCAGLVGGIGDRNLDGRRAHFGAHLRGAREARKLSLDDIARTTRIPERSLERLEAGRFDELPADVFVRGFVRSYARCVGLDVDATIERYSQCGLSPAPVATAAASELARLYGDQATAESPNVRVQAAERPATRSGFERAPTQLGLEPPVTTPITETAPVATAPAAEPTTPPTSAVVSPGPAAGSLAEAPAARAETVTAGPETQPGSKAGRKRRRNSKHRGKRSKRTRLGTANGGACAKAPATASLGVIRDDRGAEPAAEALADSTNRAHQPAPVGAAPDAAPEALLAASPAPAEPTAPAESPVGSAARSSRAATAASQRASTSAAPGLVPRLIIDDEDPDAAERLQEERAARRQREETRRTFLPAALLDGEDSNRRGTLTLAVIILVIVATLTMSYLLRRPEYSGDGMTQRSSAPADPIG